MIILLQKKKSEVAANAVQKFNPALNIRPLAEIVAESTEQIFHDDFFHQLNGICNALDNVEARSFSHIY
jgi:ubiquitin-activating enzyme E1